MPYSLHLFLEAHSSWASSVLDLAPKGPSLDANLCQVSGHCLLSVTSRGGGYDFRVMWRDWEESRQMVGALLEGRAHQHLVDFDCHLDDIRQDWTNQQLNTQITQWVGPTNGKT